MPFLNLQKTIVVLDFYLYYNTFETGQARMVELTETVPRSSAKKLFWKIFQNLQETTCDRISL